MIAPPRVRKVILTAHVVASVGWLGAVAAYIALDVVAVAGRDVQAVRSAYIAMELVAVYAIVPLALASVAIGIVNALTTSWGLFRHYWVLMKFLLTLVAGTVLLLETETIRAMAAAARSGVDPRDLPGSLPHSIGGLILLLIVTILSIYKPRGLTRHGWRRQQELRSKQRESSASRA